MNGVDQTLGQIKDFYRLFRLNCKRRDILGLEYPVIVTRDSLNASNLL